MTAADGGAPATGRILVVAAPRSGAGLLHTLMLADARWSASGLSDPSFVIPRDASDLAGAVQSTLSAAGPLTVDWLPRWSTRVAELSPAVPDLTFVHVIRDPRYAVSSSVTAWRSGRFVTAPDLPGWWGEQWSFPLVPDWESLIGRPLHEIVARQWLTISESIRSATADLPTARSAVVTYESLVADPEGVIASVAAALGLPWAAQLPDELPHSRATLTPPDPTRALRDLEEIVASLGTAQESWDDYLAFAARHGAAAYTEPVVVPPPPRIGGVTRPSSDTPFRSEATRSFIELLEKSNSSIVLTTYKSGNLIVARANNGKVDTAVLRMDRPMGVAVGGNRLAVGTADSILTYANHPSLGASLGSERPFDAVFVPRLIAYTGDIAIHEMGFDSDGQVWFVNTRFSCLCTLDMENSFTPRWRPRWISALAAEDRCHLNGLAMEGGRPRYVTALAQTDTANGWREHKGTSGLIVDVTTDEVIVGGLAMPHSPRLYGGALWVLESGRGALVRIDRRSGERTQVANVPGFARGLAFLGRYAIVGLSQVRESVFTGLPITESAAERNCGAWIVDLEAGTVVGRLRFTGVVQEIFDVAALPDVSYPLITGPGELTGTSFILSPDTLAQLGPR